MHLEYYAKYNVFSISRKLKLKEIVTQVLKMNDILIKN